MTLSKITSANVGSPLDVVVPGITECWACFTEHSTLVLNVCSSAKQKIGVIINNIVSFTA